jgi:hypothetical protein
LVPERLFAEIKSEPVITALSGSFLLSFTLWFFGPSTLYFTNIFEFEYAFSDICPYLLALTIFCGIVLTIISLSVKGKRHQRIICIIFSFGLLFYIQGNILVWDYGLLDGHEIIWNNFLLNGLIDTLIWAGVIAFSYIRYEKIYKFIPISCIFLLIIQTGGFLALIHFAPDEPGWKSYSFIYDESEFEFSENSNVIIIVLDAFQSDMFQEIINDDDDYKEMFTGFIYYRNTVGGYPSTVASIPLILTGEYFNNSVPFDTFIQTSYKSESLPKIFKEHGYITDVYGYSRLVYPDKDLESNVQPNFLNHEVMLYQLEKLGKLTIFRQSPYFFKETTYPLLIDVYHEKKSGRFVERLKKQSIRLNETPIFKFYHLDVPHMPFLLNEHLEYGKLPDNRAGYKEQSKASLQIVGNLLERLKEKGIFDKSMIVVVADHGVSNNAYGINLSQMQSIAAISYVSQNVVTGGLPLMLVKPLNSTRPFTISDAPVSISDIPKSVAAELNVSSTFAGESVFNVRETDKRNFTFYHYFLTHEYYYGDYLPPLKEYTVSNFSWYANSWHPTYREYTSRGIEIHNPPEYYLGTTIKFGNDQQSQDFTISGWSSPDDGSLWSDGGSATIAFSMNRSHSTLMNLQINAYPFIVEHKHEIQRVAVYLNKHELGNYSFTQSQPQDMEFLIEPDYLNEQVQYLTFYFPDAISPLELGISGDSRDLAIALLSFTLSEANTG